MPVRRRPLGGCRLPTLLMPTGRIFGIAPFLCPRPHSLAPVTAPPRRSAGGARRRRRCWAPSPPEVCCAGGADVSVPAELSDGFDGWARAACCAQLNRWLQPRKAVDLMDKDLHDVLSAASADRFIAVE